MLELKTLNKFIWGLVVLTSQGVYVGTWCTGHSKFLSEELAFLGKSEQRFVSCQ